MLRAVLDLWIYAICIQQPINPYRFSESRDKGNFLRKIVRESNCLQQQQVK